MAIIWALRSDNSAFAARYSAASTTAGVHGNVTWDTDATAIGGKIINMDQGALNTKMLSYSGRGIFTNQAVSVLIRAQWPGSQTAGIMEIGAGPSFLTNMFRLYQVAGDWRTTMYNETPAAATNAANAYNIAPTAATWYDMIFTWSGTTGANLVKFYLDGSDTPLGTLTAAVAATTPRTSSKTDFISLGAVDNLTNARIKINEVVIWDTAITPSLIPLTTGTGLTGAGRTAFVDVPQFDGGAASTSGSKMVGRASGFRR